jgi:hypothetical protein
MAWKEQTGECTWRVRYYRDGEIFTVREKFTTEQDALNYIADMESDQRRGRWIDPADGRIKLRAWAEMWMEALDVEPRTEENYRGLLRNHILPRWATTAIDRGHHCVGRGQVAQRVAEALRGVDCERDSGLLLDDPGGRG